VDDNPFVVVEEYGDWGGSNCCWFVPFPMAINVTKP
jgi:hypothetical protein